MAYAPALETARRRLVARAAVARGRGIALEHAAQVAGQDGRRWMARRLFGTPWPGAIAEAAQVGVLEEIAALAESLGEVSVPLRRPGFNLAMMRETCPPAALLVAQ